MCHKQEVLLALKEEGAKTQGQLLECRNYKEISSLLEPWL